MSETPPTAADLAAAQAAVQDRSALITDKDAMIRGLREEINTMTENITECEVEAGESLYLTANTKGTFHITFVEAEDEAEDDTDLLPGVDPSSSWLTAAPDWYVDVAGAYEFEMFGVWVRDDVAYWGTDRGCSCPSPWEGLRRYSDLDSGTLAECVGAYLKWTKDEDYYSHDPQSLLDLIDHLNEAGVK